MTVELAEIHVEDVKSGYILHHPEHGNCRIKDVWVHVVDADPDGPPNTVDLLIATERQPDQLTWLTYPYSTVVEVEA